MGDARATQTLSRGRVHEGPARPTVRHQPRPSKPTKLDPFKALIRTRLEEFPELTVFDFADGGLSLSSTCLHPGEPPPSPHPILGSPSVSRPADGPGGTSAKLASTPAPGAWGSSRSVRISSARLLARIYELLPLLCPACAPPRVQLDFDQPRSARRRQKSTFDPSDPEPLQAGLRPVSSGPLGRLIPSPASGRGPHSPLNKQGSGAFQYRGFGGVMQRFPSCRTLSTLTRLRLRQPEPRGRIVSYPKVGVNLVTRAVHVGATTVS